MNPEAICTMSVVAASFGVHLKWNGSPTVMAAEAAIHDTGQRVVGLLPCADVGIDTENNSKPNVSWMAASDGEKPATASV